MLRAGLAPMFADLDVVWLSNPLPYLKNFPAADILISLDLLNPNKFDGSLESCPEVLSWTLLGMQNVGIHLMRPGALPVVQACLILYPFLPLILTPVRTWIAAQCQLQPTPRT